MFKYIEDTEFPQELPERTTEDVWRVWIYWLKDGKWDAPSAPSFYTTESGWRRQWAPKKRRSSWSQVPCNSYRRVIVEKLEDEGWAQVMDTVESADDSFWTIEDTE